MILNIRLGEAHRNFVYDHTLTPLAFEELMDLTGGIKIRPKLKDRFLKILEISWVVYVDIWQENWCHMGANFILIIP